MGWILKSIGIFCSLSLLFVAHQGKASSIEKVLERPVVYDRVSVKAVTDLEYCIAIALDRKDPPRGVFRDGKRSIILAGELGVTMMVILTPLEEGTRITLQTMFRNPERDEVQAFLDLC